MFHDLPAPAGQVGVGTDLAKHQPTVLVVEDNDDTRFALAAVLAHEGYLALTAASGHDAIATLQQPLSPIDVVLLDVHLPDVDGTGLCARLRELYPKLPIVVCTGEADPDEVAELLELGAIRYFQKPVALQELLATVEAALG
jgi:DNA-binding response OmpR family regulator